MCIGQLVIVRHVRLRILSALPGESSRGDYGQMQSAARGIGISPKGTSMTTGALRSRASGISVSSSIGSSALIPTAPNESANLTKSGLCRSVP